MARTINPADSLECANSMLEDWDDICNDLGIIHYLIYGTALGFYRDGGFIKWDNDIDVRVVCSKIQWEEFCERMEAAGFNRVGEQGYSFFRDNVLMCIEMSPRAGMIVFDDGMHSSVIPVLSFDRVRYNDREYNLPHPIEKYLTTRYGNWKTPDKEWDKHSAGGY